jgi:hypothetical protein
LPNYLYDEMGRSCITHGGGAENVKHEGKRKVRRTGHRWEDNIKMES